MRRWVFVLGAFVTLLMAAPQKQTDFEFTATSLILNATRTAVVSGTGEPDFQTAFALETDPFIATQTAQALTVIPTRVAIQTEQARLAPTRTSIAVTRDLMILSRTPVPILMTATAEKRLPSTRVNRMVTEFEATATKLIFNATQTVDVALGTPPITPTATEFIAEGDVQATRTTFAQTCVFGSEADVAFRRTSDLSQLLEENGIDFAMRAPLYAYYSRNGNGEDCVEGYVVREFKITIFGKSEEEIPATIDTIMLIVSENGEAFRDAGGVPFRFTIQFVLELNFMQNYGVVIDTEYQNAIGAYREGLRGEALIEAMGGLVPFVE